MVDLIKSKVTDKAGPRINGSRVKPGDEIELTENQFNLLWMQGQVTTAKHDRAEAKAKKVARPVAKVQADGEPDAGD